MAWLASGLDQKRHTFIDNRYTGNTGNNLDFNCITEKGLLNRAHAYKAAVDLSIIEERDR